MIRAIFFDFYSVWLPNPFTEYLEQARQRDSVVAAELEATIGQYFEGKLDISQVTDTLRAKLGRPDITAEQFLLRESDISPEVTNLMRELHGHFVKLGVLANLGTQEQELLTNFNNHNQLFEVIASPLALGLQLPLLNQQVFAAAMQQIGEPPRSCLAITGDLNYQRFAESIGMMTLPFQGLPQLKQTLEQELAREVPD